MAGLEEESPGRQALLPWAMRSCQGTGRGGGQWASLSAQQQQQEEEEVEEGGWSAAAAFGQPVSTRSTEDGLVEVTC